MNKKALRVGSISALGAGISTLIFAVLILTKADMWSYAVCIFLSVFYVMMTLANHQTTAPEKKIWSQAGVAFAIVYCVMVSIVYYVQVTFVRLGNPSPEALSVVSYFPTGTAFFAIDILGYTFLALSTLFLAFSVKDKSALKVMLIIHGVVGLGGVVTPLMPFFYQAQDASTADFGTIALFAWCLLFIPVCILYARNFIQQAQSGE